MDPLVISFYTLGTPYEEEVKNLIRSCEEWKVDAAIEGIPSAGSWEKNCALKPSFILKKLKEHKRSVLWVDADAVFRKRPDFTDFAACDFAVRVNEFLPKGHESRVVSNTVFVSDIAAGIEVVEKWKESAEKEILNRQRAHEFWDQTALRDVLQDSGSLRFLPMPLKYSKIFDFDDLFISEEEVVIEHYQASRRYKDKVHGSCQNNCCH
ncbi:MAG: hypothetical protein JSS60_06695 [Verrucomicrobia bacterium]|nr:hypothetical protein [Verrucomicrobiota bacterium]